MLLIKNILWHSKHSHFCYIQIYGIYCVLSGSKYLQKIWFDSNYNQIFDYVHGTHCLSIDFDKLHRNSLLTIFLSTILLIWGRLHQHFRRSFYTLRSQKRIKDWKLDCLFAHLGYLYLKALRKHVKEIDPWCPKNWFLKNISLHLSVVLIFLFVIH